jgi:hypothetical protein
MVCPPNWKIEIGEGKRERPHRGYSRQLKVEK